MHVCDYLMFQSWADECQEFDAFFVLEIEKLPVISLFDAIYLMSWSLTVIT